MGEAKRRLAAQGRTIRYTDATTGEVVDARAGGDPEAVWGLAIDGVVDYLKGEGDGSSSVPCNGCTECCYHGGVDISPERDAGVMRYLDIEWRDDGPFLRKRADGACVHLGPNGCTVYEHRPFACRNYDCRLYAVTGVLDRFDGEHKQPYWIFEPPNDRARAFLAAAQLLGHLEFQRLLRDGKDCSAQDVSQAVFNDPDRFYKACKALLSIIQLPPEQQRQLFRSIVPNPGDGAVKQYVDAMAALAPGYGHVLVRES